MNYIKIETSRISYRVVGVFCDFDEVEIIKMLEDFDYNFQLEKEHLIKDGLFKVSVIEVDSSLEQRFKFNVVERIK